MPKKPSSKQIPLEKESSSSSESSSSFHRKYSPTRACVRSVCGISYLSKDQFLNIISNHSKQVRHYAFILHDRDYFNEGDRKGEKKDDHLHFILLFWYPYSKTAIDSWFRGFVDQKGLPINTHPQGCTDLLAYHRYLTHKDYPEKAQYRDDEIETDDPLTWIDDHEEKSCEDNAFVALELMLAGKSRFEIAKALGRDFIYHYSQIRELYEDIIWGDDDRFHPTKKWR